MASMPKGHEVDASLADASASLRCSMAVEVEKPSKETNIVGIISAVQEDISDPAIQAVTPIATQTVQLFESQVDKLVSASGILTSALEDLARIHPFVSIVVLAFKTALKFEMTRRENDKRVMLVRAKMNDTLSVLLVIRPIAANDTANDGKTVESRISARIQAIANDIKKYATLCDGFSKKKKLIKLLRSLEWESKLESFVKIFDGHKQALQEDLAIYTSLGVHQANETLATISSHLGTAADTVDTLYLLQLLRSPADRQLISDIAQMGGTEKVLNDEGLMQKLIKQSGDKDAEGEDVKVVVKDVVLEFSKSFAETMQENEEVFTRKFNAWQQALQEEMQTIVRRESDRVIGAITSGPHDRIIDKDLYEVWKESGWKGTTKARSLVLGLREYYAERRKAHTLSQHQALQGIYRAIAPTDSSQATVVQQPLFDAGRPTELEDEWALDFITVSRMQPLLEAFDEDASSLVSVSEVNAFSSARPANWSLIKWMAYWAAGYPHTLIYYLRRIPILSGRIGVLAKQVRKSMPDNLFLVDYLVNHYPILCADLITAGVYDDLENSIFQWKHDVFDRFRDYVDEEEAKMKKKLESLKYCIDAQDTLEFVMGSARIEKNLLPLIYLLLFRVWHVLRHAREVPLNPRELVDLVTSIETVMSAIHDRVEHLTATSKLQNLDPRKQLRKFSHGIYYYCADSSERGLFGSNYFISCYLPSTFKASIWPFYDFWLQEDIIFSAAKIWEPEIVIIEEDKPPEPLYYPKQDLDLHVDVYDEHCTGQSSLSPDSDSNAWSGHFSTKQYDGSFAGSYSSGVWYLVFPPGGGDGQITGSGMDGKGDFSISGHVRGRAVVCNVERASDVLRFSGTLNLTRDSLEGVYGTPTRDQASDPDVILGEPVVVEGRFELRKAPVRFSYLEPSVEALTLNKARALWKFAIESVMNIVRIKVGHFTWPFLKDRRRIRHRFLELYSRLEGAFPDVPSPWRTPMEADEEHELASLVALCSKQDLLFYRKLALVLRRRQAVYWSSNCESCFDRVTNTLCICLDCLVVDRDSGKPSGIPTAFCLKCFLKPKTRDKYDTNHVQSHAVYQLRSPPSRKEEWGMILFARDLLAAMRTIDVKRDRGTTECHYCRRELEAPYWRCVDCKERLHICVSCKANKDDAQAREAELSFSTYGQIRSNWKNASPADAQTDATRDAEQGSEVAADAPESVAHSFRHGLLFYQPDLHESKTTNGDTEVSVTDLLHNLQHRVDSFDSRLERIEALLARLLSAPRDAAV